jgi:hypothetical protein
MLEYIGHQWRSQTFIFGEGQANAGAESFFSGTNYFWRPPPRGRQNNFRMCTILGVQKIFRTN